MPHVSASMQNCIDECQNCHEICVQTVEHCLTKGGKHAAPEHIRTLSDCAEICQTSANFMLRGSEIHPEVCGTCAEVCDLCAASCERIGNEDFMKQCADGCRRCAESCRQMAGSRKAA